MATNDDLVLWSVEGPVAVLTLNRPERLNAWTPALMTRCWDLLDRAADDREVRAIVITGAGRGFCAGADMDVLQGAEAGAPDPRPVTYATRIPKPVIGAINGPVAGIGLAMAMAFDVRIAARGAKITTAFPRRGLIAEHGLSWLLPQIIGRAHAMDLLLSGRIVLAEDAERMGLVNRVVEPGDARAAAVEYGRDLAAHCSPTSMAVIKDQLNRHPLLPLDDAVAESNVLMAASLERPDFREGVRSFLEKRAPAFAPAPPRSR